MCSACGSSLLLRAYGVERDRRARAPVGAVLDRRARPPAAHQLASDRQAKAGPGRTGATSSATVEPLEHLALLARGEARPAVEHLHPPPAGLDPHVASRRRVPQRVL